MQLGFLYGPGSWLFSQDALPLGNCVNSWPGWKNSRAYVICIAQASGSANLNHVHEGGGAEIQHCSDHLLISAV